MARLPRLYLSGCPQHVIQRGNNRAACFFEEGDYKTYLVFLKESAAKYNVAIHAFVLMTNHVHLLASPSDKTGVSRMMQALGRRYVQYVNHKYQRSGTLWEGRYKSTLIDSETYLLVVYRYIELNPVRATMVAHASEYPWSSYQGNALGKVIELLNPHPLYLSLGKSIEERCGAYRALFRGRMAERDLQAIRDATNRAWVLGDGRFKRQVEAATGRSAAPTIRGGDRKSMTYKNSKDQRL